MDDSSVRYKEMARKGYASPSLAADSAARIRLRFVGTCLIANLPPVYMAGLIRVAHRITGSDEPTMAAQIMGSVGVRQAAITKDEMKLIGGKITKTRPAELC